MISSQIASFIGHFNILSTIVLAFVAIYGSVTLIVGKLTPDSFQGKPFIKAFGLSILLAFVLEITLFNYPSHQKHFAGEEFYTTEVSPQDSTVLFTTDSTVSAKRVFKIKEIRADGRSRNSVKDTVWAVDEIVFEGLDRKITSIYIEPKFGDNESVVINIKATDEFDTRWSGKVLHRGFPRDHYIPVQYFGKVSKLTVVVGGAVGEISHIAVNKPIPFYLSGLRIFVVACFFFVIILFADKKLRVKASYFLFEYKFNSADRKQNLIYAFIVVLILLFSGISAFTSTSKFWTEEYVGDMQYNVFLVDALLAGRAYLDAGRPEMLQLAERPFDLAWLGENNFAGRGDWWYGDWVYYKGKFYCYFGVVPAVILFAPYKLITGNYLPNYAGIFVFIGISIILMAILWRHCVKKYMPDTKFVFYLLGFLTLFFASALFAPLRFTRFYSIVTAGGFMFTVAGILLLLKSVEREKVSGIKLFFACLSFALAVGCRPNLVFVSILVPVVLWKYRSFRTAVIVAIPYILVAIPLCYYNYIRFGSILDFGFKYNMTNINTGGNSLLNPIARALNVFVTSVSSLFTLNSYSHLFPYVECHPEYKFSVSAKRFYDKGVGIINFPVVLFLGLYFKNLFVPKNLSVPKEDKGMDPLVSSDAHRHTARGFISLQPVLSTLSTTFLIIAAITVFINSWLVGVSGRYTVDFAFFIVLPSILYGYYWCNGNYQVNIDNGQSRKRLKIAYTLLALSIFVGLFLFATNITNDATPGNPALYRYLEYSLGFVNSF